MSRRSVLPARGLVAAVAASALAAIGLVVAPPAQAAAPANVTTSISPTSVNVGSTTTFDLTIKGGSTAQPSSLTVQVPTAFATVSVVAGSFSGPTGWTQGFTNTPGQPQTITFTSNDKDVDLTSLQQVRVQVSAKAPNTPADYTWTTTAYENKTLSGQTVTVESSPVVTVTGGSQTISFASLATKTYGDPDFAVSATGGASGNPVTFSAGGDCTSTGTNGATIHLTGAGSCTVTANQAGGNGYTAAAPVSQGFTINKASQTITFAAIATKTYGDGPLSLSATGGGSGNAVTFTTSGSCSVSGTTLTLTGAGTCTVYADQAGNSNYLAAPQVSRTFTINKASASLELSGLTHIYNGSAQGATVTTAPAGLSGVSVTYGGSATVPSDAGSYSVVATLDNPNYAAEQVTGTLVINAKHITGAFTVAGRDYDGTTDASVTGRSLVGAVGGDDVALSGGAATFDSKNAGSRTATLSGYSLSGDDSANYLLDSVAPATATISKLQVTGTIVAGDKTYDGDTSATVTQKSIAGKIGSDDLQLDVVSAAFDGANAGPHTVNATIALSGDDAGNYKLASTTVTDDANIWKVELTGTWTAKNKVYDSTTAAEVKTTALPSVVGDEDVTLVVDDPSFADANVGDDKDVTGTLSLSGADIGNYTLLNSGTSTVKADITPKALTGSFTAKNKVYDGNTTAEVDTVSLPDVIGTDDVILDVADPIFGSKNVGTGKTVTGTLSLSGDDAGNYALADDSDNTASADITVKPLTASFTAKNKVYDGNITAEVDTVSLPGVIGTDDVILDVGLPTFGNKDVGTDKTVTGTLSLSGDDAGNYALAGDSDNTANADISARPLVGSFTAHDKVYDGNTDATITDRVLDDVVGSEDVALQGGTTSFADKNVGTWTVTLDGATLGGADAGNYSLSSVDTETADITKLTITGSITPNNKVYDGNTGATASASLSGVIGLDAVGVTPSNVRFDGKNVGAHQVTADLTLTGTAEGNYQLSSSTASGQADITARHLTGSFAAQDKVYDGNASATISNRALDDVVAGEDVTLTGGTASYDSKNVGDRTVTLSGASLGGTDKANYALDGVSTGSAKITRLTVHGAFTAYDKVWDGNAAASIKTRSLLDAVAGDDVALSGGTAAFADANVAAGKTVTATGFALSGADAGNYSLAGSSWTTTASITALYSGKGFYAPVDMTPSGGIRIYNTIKGGQTVPLKFEIYNAAGTVEQTSLAVFGADATAQGAAFKLSQVTCTTSSTEDAIEQLAATGGTSVRYDTTAGQYVQNWKTPTTVNTCWSVSVKAVDGTTVGAAYFKITK